MIPHNWRTSLSLSYHIISYHQAPDSGGLGPNCPPQQKMDSWAPDGWTPGFNCLGPVVQGPIFLVPLIKLKESRTSSTILNLQNQVHVGIRIELTGTLLEWFCHCMDWLLISQARLHVPEPLPQNVHSLPPPNNRVRRASKFTFPPIFCHQQGYNPAWAQWTAH